MPIHKTAINNVSGAFCLPGGTVGVGPELAEDSHTVQVADLAKEHKWSFKIATFSICKSSEAN
jgi:hypothetical protein